MDILRRYVRQYWQLVALALVLAAVNQFFPLLDPLIFRHIIDNYVTHFGALTHAEFFKGVGLLLAASMGVAFVSRVAKNFQDYYLNVITQRSGFPSRGRFCGGPAYWFLTKRHPRWIR